MLSQEHLSLLTRESGIRADIVESRGYETMSWDSSNNDLTDRHKLRSAGIGDAFIPVNPRGEYAGMLIPVFSPIGERVSLQWRPDYRMGDIKAKYVHPEGSGNRLDVHPINISRLHDIGTPLVITEGVKKADALTSSGHLVIALSGVWNWKNADGPIRDWKHIPLKGRKVYVIFDSDGVKNRLVNQAISGLIEMLNSMGVTEVVARFVPVDYQGLPTKGVDDFLVAGGTFENIIEHGTEPISVKKYYFDHAHMAELVSREVLAGNYCFTDATGWMHYTGKVWERCGEAPPMEAIRQYISTNTEKAGMLAVRTQNQADEKVYKGWKSMLSGGALIQILRLCRGIEPLYQRFEDFDTDRDVLNCQNGLLDLRTGTLDPHNFTQLVTKITYVEYDPTSTHKDWDKALEAIPADVIDWAQIRYGQGITGHMPSDDKLIIEHGRGSNGKSTIVDGVSGALGDYYRLVSNKILLASDRDGVPTEFMDLKGLRFAQLEETPEARRLDVNKMKQTVGTSQITARYMRQDSITFDTTHSMFITTNNVPVVNETDEGSWRRLALFRYPYTFRTNAGDIKTEWDRLGEEGLKQRVKLDKGVHKAALAWLVRGAVTWYEADCIMPPLPPRIANDTMEWRMGSDLVMRFVEERIVFAPNEAVSTKELYDVLIGWLEDTGHRSWSMEVMLSKFLNHELFVQAGCKKERILSSKVTSRSYGRTEAISSKQVIAVTGIRFRKASDEE